MITNWKSDVLKEKSLQEVFRASKKLPKSPFNKLVYAIGGFAITAVAVVWLGDSNVRASASATGVAADIAFELSVQILGFLIGGFAIFATVTDDRLMIRLAQITMPKSDLSVFKHVFFNFLSVFYIYIVTLGCAVLVKLGGSLGLIDPVAVLRWKYGADALTIVNTLTFAALAWLIMLSVVRLKSFIWNIYQGFITFLAASDVLQKEADARLATPDAE